MAADTDPLPPRGWLVSQFGHQAVILAESHVAVPEEIDSYYETLMVPAFGRSQWMLAESAGDADSNKVLQERCPDETTLTADPQVKAALHTYLQSGGENDWDTHQPQWGMAHVFLSIIGLHFQMKAGHVIDITDGGLTLDLLKRKPGRLPRPLDDSKRMLSDWCAAPKSLRNDFLYRQIVHEQKLLAAAKNGKDLHAEAEQTAVVMMKWILRCVDEPFRCDLTRTGLGEAKQLDPLGFTVGGLPASAFRLMVVNRNISWRATIQSALQERSRVFIVLGGSHVLDTVVDGTRFPGILTQLQAAGATVKRIRNAEDLSAYMADD